AGLDRCSERNAVPAKAECNGLVERRRKIEHAQAFGEHAGKDQLAVDQNAVAIKDDQIGHGFPINMARDKVVCHPPARSSTMPRFCANLGFLFAEVPFLERFDAAARAGFTAVEYAAPYDYPAGELRTRLKDAGLTQVLINSPVGNREAG